MPHSRSAKREPPRPPSHLNLRLPHSHSCVLTVTATSSPHNRRPYLRFRGIGYLLLKKLQCVLLLYASCHIFIHVGLNGHPMDTYATVLMLVPIQAPYMRSIKTSATVSMDLMPLFCPYICSYMWSTPICLFSCVHIGHSGPLCLTDSYKSSKNED